MSAALALWSLASTGVVDARVDYVQLEGVAGRVTDVVAADVDGDGSSDLVIATGTGDDDEGEPAPRTLRVHLRRSNGSFSNVPDAALPLVKNVVAFAVADVAPAPGRELVLFSAARAVAAWWPEPDGEPTFAALVETRFLWQPADPNAAFAWQDGVLDLDADGLEDLLLPEPGGYRVALQRRAADGVRFEAARLELPPVTVDEDRRSVARFADEPQLLPGGRRRPESWARVRDAVPLPRVIDWDGDGRLDLVALVGRLVAVWQQDADGRLRYRSGHELPERRTALLSPSYGVLIEDLDGDRRADLVLVSSRTEDDEVTSIVEIFLQKNGPGYQRTADDKLRLQGFVHVPSLDDVDHDGRPDMAIGSLRPDVIGSLTSGRDGGVEAQLNLFRNRFLGDRPRFQRPVALVHKERLPSELGQGWSVIARFATDLDGDGLRDLLLRTREDRVELRRTIERGRGLGVGDPLWRLDLAAGAPARWIEERSVLLVQEATQVVHVELR